MSLLNAYLIKGWPLDREPPAAITEALEAIIATLGGMRTQDDGVDERYHRLADPRPDDQSEPDAPSAAEPPAPAPATPPGSAAAPARKPPTWSPEARAAAAERMRARQVNGGLRKPAGEPTPKPAPPVPAKQYTPVPADKLIHDHAGYAGRRDPGQRLTDEDWPDIKTRLTGSPDRRGIARDYDVDPDDLSAFIASCQRREARRSGEAPASPFRGTSDATRRPT